VTIGAATVEDVGALGRHRERWDALAVAARRPYACPAWMLAWWEHARPRDAQLRVVVAERDGRLVGVAPLFAAGGRYAPLGHDCAGGAEPLAEPEREREVANAVAAALADASPRPRVVALAGQGEDPNWAALLADAWPGAPPRRRSDGVVPAPYVEVPDGGYDEWLSGRSRNFRQWIRRRQRNLETAGGGFRLSSEETVADDARELMRLHHARLTGRGGSSLVADGLVEMLAAAGRELIPSGRFRLLCLEVDGKLASAQLFLAAGDVVSYWNGGFDDAYAEHSPSMLGLVQAIATAAERGERRLDLGAGGQDYKYRLTGEELQLRSHLLLPRGRGHARTLAGVALRDSLRAGSRRLRQRSRTVPS
jgi:CelD/BcsL family acetyltransferase involved in cellulose biosynthesis